MKVYVASSWRNVYYQDVVRELRENGHHQVYDFRNNGFKWSEIDPKWEEWDTAQYKYALEHPLAQNGLIRDVGGMAWCDTLVLVMPAGRSACLELGWAIGQRKKTIVYIPIGEKIEPELMFGLAGKIVGGGVADLLEALDSVVP